MAVTWDVEITVKDLARKEVSVRAMRTDGVEVRGPYIITSRLLDTSGKWTLASIRDDCVGMLRGQYLEELARETAVEAVVAGYEDALGVALEAAEVV